MKKLKKAAKKKLIEGIKILIVLVSVFILTNIFIAEMMIISGSSMEPNFHDNEQILSEKMSFRFSNPKRGQVVVLKQHDSNRIVIKRIIATPGETLLISHGQVFIDGKRLEESYLSENLDTEGGKTIPAGTNYKVPPNSYIVLGDNRGDSLDSREWGPVEKSSIIARTILVYYPVKNLRVVTL